MQYIQYGFPNMESEAQDRLIALLAGLGFEGFEERDEELLAYIPAEHTQQDIEKYIQENFPGIRFTMTEILPQNWNQIWESEFEPVRIGDFAGVRADFHKPLMHVQHEIIITPKMSFGTGHHATTYQMIANMEKMDFTQKRVIDYGSGTAVLAILAEKLGATYILAIDNDPNCIENALENIAMNDCHAIHVQQADTIVVEEPVDCILANINLNIILAQLPAMHTALKPGGEILLSGLLLSDEEKIHAALKENGFTHLQQTEKNGWIAIGSRR